MAWTKRIEVIQRPGCVTPPDDKPLAELQTGVRNAVQELLIEQLSNVVDSAMKNDQAATLSSVVVSSSVTLIPSLNLTPSSTSPTSSWPLHRRQRSWAASKSL